MSEEERKNSGRSLWFLRWEEGEGIGEEGTRAQFDPVTGDLENMSLGSHLQKKIRNHISQTHRRKIGGRGCLLNISPCLRGRDSPRGLEAEILYPAQGYFELLTWLQHLNSRQKKKKSV